MPAVAGSTPASPCFAGADVVVLVDLEAWKIQKRSARTQMKKMTLPFVNESVPQIAHYQGKTYVIMESKAFLAAAVESLPEVLSELLLPWARTLGVLGINGPLRTGE